MDRDSSPEQHPGYEMHDLLAFVMSTGKFFRDYSEVSKGDTNFFAVGIAESLKEFGKTFSIVKPLLDRTVDPDGKTTFDFPLADIKLQFFEQSSQQQGSKRKLIIFNLSTLEQLHLELSMQLPGVQVPIYDENAKIFEERECSVALYFSNESNEIAYPQMNRRFLLRRILFLSADQDNEKIHFGSFKEDLKNPNIIVEMNKPFNGEEDRGIIPLTRRALSRILKRYKRHTLLDYRDSIENFFEDIDKQLRSRFR